MSSLDPTRAYRRAELRAAGWSEGTITRAHQSRSLIRVAPDTWIAAGPVRPPLASLLAAVGRHPVLSHESAALVWGLPVTAERTHLIVARGRGARRVPGGVVLHQSFLAPDDIAIVNGVRVTSVARTLWDLAANAPLEVAVAAIDAALHGRLIGFEELTSAVASRARVPGSRRVRRALALADGRSESPLESMLRLVLVLAGLTPAGIQHVIRGVGRVDFWFEGLVVEADGFAYHADRASYRTDRRRDNACARLGLLVLRFTWEDVVGNPEGVVAEVRAALRWLSLQSAAPGARAAAS